MVVFIYTISFSFLALGFPLQGFAAGTAVEASENQKPFDSKGGKSEKIAAHKDDPAFIYSRDPERPRSDFGIPFLSLLLPGFDQWWEGQFKYAGIYTGGYIISGNLGEYYKDKYEKRTGTEVGTVKDEGLFPTARELRWSALARQTTNTFGAFSAYQSFRSAANSRKSIGEYGFLTNDDTLQSIALAPFDFTHLSKPTTWIPLLIISSWVSLGIDHVDRDENDVEFSHQDATFSLGSSYNAGVWEEAAYRGWLLPYFNQRFQSQKGANALVAGLFAIEHATPSNPVPLAQFGMGWYLGHLTMKRNWSIREAIFIHSWWDVIAISWLVSVKKKQLYIQLPTLTIPL